MSVSPVRELAAQLIEKESISPNDAGCQDIIRERLEKAGFEIHDYSNGGTTNTWAIRRFGEGQLIVLAGHVDVVPPGPLTDWQIDGNEISPFALTEHEGFLYGRGIADMKGAVAALVAAAESFVQKNDQETIAGGIAFLITSDEETERTNGTGYAVKQLLESGITAEYVVLGEPSSIESIGDRIYTARRGSYHLTKCVINGRAGHVAKGNGIDAAEIASRIQVAALDHEWDTNPHPRFPHTSFKTWTLEGGYTAENMVSARTVIRANWRNNPSSNAESIQKQFEELANDIYRTVAGDAEVPDQPLEFTWSFDGEPYLSDNNSEYVQNISEVIEKLTGTKPELSSGGGTSDGGSLAKLGAQVIELGVQGRTIHESNERILVGALEELQTQYEAILQTILTSK